MIEFYPQIKLFHIASVTLSGSIFALRGLMILVILVRQGQSKSGLLPLLKWSSYINDTLLLIAGLLLMGLTQQYPVSHPWLSVKLSLLVLYIGLGMYALRPGRTLLRRRLVFVMAIAVYLSIFSIARSHHPLGFLASYAIL